MTPLEKRLRRKYTRIERCGVCRRVILKVGYLRIRIEFETTIKECADRFQDNLAEALAKIVEESK